MTNQEFSDEFDALLNSYAGSNAYGRTAGPVELDEYEKSVFLTKAQEELLTGYYNGKNQFRESFEKTEEIRRYLSSLIKTKEQEPAEDEDYPKISSNSTVFNLPNNLWFITFEGVYITPGKCNEGMVAVVPVSQDEYHRIKKNPFRGTTARRALRLDLEDNKVEIITDVKNGAKTGEKDDEGNDTKYSIKYFVRYLEKPAPIILESFDGVSINGSSKQSECALDSMLHRPILELAVQLALRSRGMYNTNNQQ